MTTKLTPPQLALLQSIAGCPRYVGSYYRPRGKLLNLGYVRPHGKPRDGWLEITDAGREYLEGKE